MAKKTKQHFEISSKQRVKLKKLPTKLKPKYRSDDEYNLLLEKNRTHLEEYQTLLYAGRSRAMLIIFQGMDTSGKDGAIKHVMSGVNPQGCMVISFKTPSKNELDHDFLWRINQALPGRGQIGIFNRSYYEETLVTRVHKDLLELEKLPPKPNKQLWNERFQDIVNYEKYLHHQGYEIVKIFLHISKDEQKSRLLDRFKDPKKLWKISEGDVHERIFWKEYQSAYEEAIQFTSTKHCPWYIVPSNDKKNARLIISQILVDRLKSMKLDYPSLSAEEMRKLKKLRSLLKRD